MKGKRVGKKREKKSNGRIFRKFNRLDKERKTKKERENQTDSHHLKLNVSFVEFLTNGNSEFLQRLGFGQSLGEKNIQKRSQSKLEFQKKNKNKTQRN